MNDRQRGTWTEQEVADNYDRCETQLLQAQATDQLAGALALFTDSSVGSRNLVGMYKLAGPARVVSLILRGYELPHEGTRYRSARALLDIDAILQQSDRKGELSEQIWLILAAQQDIILQQIESDLEALYCELDNDQIKEQRDVLGRAHALIRKRAGVAVDQLLAVGEYA